MLHLCSFCVRKPYRWFLLAVGHCPAAKLDLHAAFIYIVNQPIKNDLFCGNWAVSHVFVISISKIRCFSFTHLLCCPSFIHLLQNFMCSATGSHLPQMDLCGDHRVGLYMGSIRMHFLLCVLPPAEQNSFYSHHRWRGDRRPVY